MLTPAQDRIRAAFRKVRRKAKTPWVLISLPELCRMIYPDQTVWGWHTRAKTYRTLRRMRAVKADIRATLDLVPLAEATGSPLHIVAPNHATRAWFLDPTR